MQVEVIMLIVVVGVRCSRSYGNNCFLGVLVVGFVFVMRVMEEVTLIVL